MADPTLSFEGLAQNPVPLAGVAPSGLSIATLATGDFVGNVRVVGIASFKDEALAAKGKKNLVVDVTPTSILRGGSPENVGTPVRQWIVIPNEFIANGAALTAEESADPEKKKKMEQTRKSWIRFLLALGVQQAQIDAGISLPAFAQHFATNPAAGVLFHYRANTAEGGGDELGAGGRRDDNSRLTFFTPDEHAAVREGKMAHLDKPPTNTRRGGPGSFPTGTNAGSFGAGGGFGGGGFGGGAPQGGGGFGGGGSGAFG